MESTILGGLCDTLTFDIFGQIAHRSLLIYHAVTTSGGKVYFHRAEWEATPNDSNWSLQLGIQLSSCKLLSSRGRHFYTIKGPRYHKRLCSLTLDLYHD